MNDNTRAEITEGITQLELMKLIQKRKDRFSAIILADIEEEQLEQSQQRRIRKIVLDGINSYTRGLYKIIGIDIEGLTE